MATYKARILASDADADALAVLMTEFLDPPPAVSFARSEGRCLLEVYFAARPDPAALNAIAESGERFAPIRNLELELVPDENWVEKTQQGLHPISAGRFFVHGSHDRMRAAGKPYRIEIDAGQAFGTAHHGTTRGCLLLLDRLAKTRQIRSVLDLGTGSGVLAIAAAQALRCPVIAADIDPIAIDVARGNIARSGVGARVRTVVAEGLAHPLIASAAPFDLILANILAEPLIELAPAIFDAAARDNGRLILSGLLDNQAREVQARYRSEGFALSAKLSLEGWATLLLHRQSRT